MIKDKIPSTWNTFGYQLELPDGPHKTYRL